MGRRASRSSRWRCNRPPGWPGLRFFGGSPAPLRGRRGTPSCMVQSGTPELAGKTIRELAGAASSWPAHAALWALHARPAGTGASKASSRSPGQHLRRCPGDLRASSRRGAIQAGRDGAVLVLAESTGELARTPAGSGAGEPARQATTALVDNTTPSASCGPLRERPHSLGLLADKLAGLETRLALRQVPWNNRRDG